MSFRTNQVIWSDVPTRGIEATLTGETTGGTHIKGTDTVNIVPKRK